MGNLLAVLLPMGLVMAILGLGGWLYVRYRVKIGEKWEHNKVARSLHRFALLCNARTLDDVKLVDNGLSGWADHLLISSFGVVLVYDLCYSGEYSGKADAEKWLVRIRGRGTWSIPNPRIQAAACVGRVNTLLKKAGIHLPVSYVAVLANTHRSTVSFVRSDGVVKLRQLHSYLEQETFKKEYPVDVEEVLKVLKAGQVSQ
ncbi:MAG: NERD domain-containing protein [Anaerotruncus sp.]|nr:NERD domain-containing protein [Anaerotruncus sp.]